MLKVPRYLVAVFGCLAAAAAEGQWDCTDLHPIVGYSDSFVIGASLDTQVGYATGSSTPVAHAVLWSGTAQSCVDLHPSGFNTSVANGISGFSQVGSAEGENGIPQAMLWHGTAESAVNLTPSGYNGSVATAASGTRQVGFGYPVTGSPHALLWSGTANSSIDLNPSGYRESYALGMTGNSEVGYGYLMDDRRSHALVWSGTSVSAVDLNGEYQESTARAVFGGTQVGLAYLASNAVHSHAILWSGTADSAVDLNPAGFIGSDAYGVAEGFQVGTAWASDTETHAFLWSGTAASAIDLQGFLGSNYTQSEAQGLVVASSGVTIVGSALNSTTNHWDAVMWTPVPEPGSLTVLAIGSWVTLRLRRSHQRS